MARSEEGDFELILGNRQLLSVLFILVVLLGVFFTMGYIVGRNNPKAERLMAATAASENGEKAPPVTVEPGGASSAPALPPPPAVVDKPSPLDEGPSDTPVRKETARQTAPKEESKKEEKKKEVKPAAPDEPAERPAGIFTTTPSPGLYLQVAAIDRPGATGLAEAYRKKKFPALVTSSSSAALFRVIIGPLRDNEEVADTKTRLEKMGVKGSVLKKY